MAEGSQPCSRDSVIHARMHPFHRDGTEQRQQVHRPAPCSAVQRSRLLWTAHDKQRPSAHDEQRRSALDSGARNSARRSGSARSRRTEVRKPRAAAYIKCA
jgi:hypothetical protein